MGTLARFIERPDRGPGFASQKVAAAGLAAIAAACVLLAGCSGLETVYADMEFGYRDIGMTDRCVHFVKQAFPEIRLADVKAQSSADMDNATARIEGVNENASSTGQLARNVAAECRFKNGILTEFRWTAGPFR